MKNTNDIKRKGINYIMIAIVAVIAIIIVTISIIVVTNIVKEKTQEKEKIVVDLVTLNEELQKWITQRRVVFSANGQEFNVSTISADSTSVKIGNDVSKDITIYSILTSLDTIHDGIYARNLVIKEGKIALVDDENIAESTLTKEQIKWIKEELAINN